MAAGQPESLAGLVVGVFNDRPVFLKDVATVRDGPAEVVSYVRHGWGPARGFEAPQGFPGTLVGDRRTREGAGTPGRRRRRNGPDGGHAGDLQAEGDQRGDRRRVRPGGGRRNCGATSCPRGMELIITRNSGLTADEKVNELVEGLWVAIVIVIALLTLSLGWREAFIVAVAVPVVFGLTLGVNLLFGYTINRVTLFALILSLGLLVDDPIVDVENIARHFAMRGRATRDIVLEAVAEIRPAARSARRWR